MILVKNQRERTRFIRFVIVGIIGTVVDFIVFNLLLVLGLEEHLAQALSFTVAVFSNFTWNRVWTYPDSRSKKAFTPARSILCGQPVGPSHPHSDIH